MNSIEDQIDTFIDPDFNAEEAARQFFASNTENELSRKLNEMTGIQTSVEAILKQKVRQNYKIFLHANDEISRVGKEMVDLNLLIGHTQGLIENISRNREGEHLKTVLMRRNRTSTVKRRMAEPSFQPLSVKYGDINKDIVTNIPPVIMKAPDNLVRLVIEQMYPQAVQLISQLQEYFSGVIEEEGDIIPTSPLAVIVRKVKEISTQLASQLKKSLVELPNSSLWGADERRRRLKLLVELGRADMAAEGFVLSQADLIRTVMNNVQERHLDTAFSDFSETSMSSGGVAGLAYARDLCSVFFSALADSCSSYLELFAEQREDSSIVSLLLLWAQKQVAAFVPLLAKQIQRGAYDHSARVINQLRASTTGTPSDRSPSFHSSSSSYSHSSSYSRIAQDTSLQPVFIAKNVPVGSGPLSFTSKCLELAFGGAGQLDTLGLHGRVTLTWLLLADVQRATSDFTEDLLREISLEVRQDSWTALLVPSCTVMSPCGKDRHQSHGEADIETRESVPILASSSYNWMVNTLSFFLREVWILIQGDALHSIKGSADADADADRKKDAFSYSRADLCETEPAIVASILRLCVRYVSQLESVCAEGQVGGEVPGFSHGQLQCYAATLKAVSSKLLPSVLQVVENSLYSEGLSQLGHSPEATIAILIARVQHLSSLEIHRLSTEMTLLMDAEVDHAIQLRHNERELEKKVLRSQLQSSVAPIGTKGSNARSTLLSNSNSDSSTTKAAKNIDTDADDGHGTKWEKEKIVEKRRVGFSEEDGERDENHQQNEGSKIPEKKLVGLDKIKSNAKSSAPSTGAFNSSIADLDEDGEKTSMKRLSLRATTTVAVAPSSVKMQSPSPSTSFISTGDASATAGAVVAEAVVIRSTSATALNDPPASLPATFNNTTHNPFKKIESGSNISPVVPISNMTQASSSSASTPLKSAFTPPLSVTSSMSSSSYDVNHRLADNPFLLPTQSLGGSHRPLSVSISHAIDRDKEREKVSSRSPSGTFKSPTEKEKGSESARKNPYLKSPSESIGGETEKRVSLKQASGSRDRRIGRRAYDVEGDDDVVEF